MTADSDRERRAVPFTGLNAGVRKQVAAAAARGELHSDPVVAASSIEWARSHCAGRMNARTVGSLALGMVVDVVALGGLPDGGGVAQQWRASAD